MRRLTAITVILAIAITAFPAKKERTTRRGLKVETRGSDASTPVDSAIKPSDGAIRLAGYDKPLRSRHETIFATNSLPDSLKVTSVKLTLTYRDSQGRQLHRQSLWVDGEIPAGETRLLRFPSWDKQQSFYYRLSKQPRSVATPYNITATVDSATVVSRH